MNTVTGAAGRCLLRIVTVVGARPQFIKAAAVSRAIVHHNQSGGEPQIRETIVHTGQHYDESMSQVFFDELDIPRPAYNLGVGSLPHGAQTGRMLEGIEGILLKEHPDWVLVYGDTNSTLAGALAAAKLHIPVAHVEAGLRSFNRRMPEEINRVLTDDLSTLLLCPTRAAVGNLAAEGIESGVTLVGDVMYDCALYYADRAKMTESETLGKYGLRARSYYLATVHRAENTDDRARMTQVAQAFARISTRGCPVAIPLHPRTRARLASHDLTFSSEVRVLPPLPYLEMVTLERNAKAILTDSGGVQKEALFYGVPCVTLRDETEWSETLDSGWNALVGADTERIISAVAAAEHPAPDPPEAYGAGRAAELCVKILVSSGQAPECRPR